MCSPNLCVHPIYVFTRHFNAFAIVAGAHVVIIRAHTQVRPCHKAMPRKVSLVTDAFVCEKTQIRKCSVLHLISYLCTVFQKRHG
jgi:hypothetical protein